MSKNIICQYASLNANSLIKSGHQSTQSNYIRYIKQQNYDIICFQEPRAKTPELIQSLNIHFQPINSIWNDHIGIVSLSPKFIITTIDTSHIYSDDRFQICKVEHPQHFYAPAHSSPLRRELFRKLGSMLYRIQDLIDFDQLIISGDFNYSLLRTTPLTSTTDTEWINLLELSFNNAMQMHNLTEIPAFQRTNGDATISSVIDYIYLGQQIYIHLQDTGIQELCAEWSDHSILNIQFTVGESPTGPGLWRANPAYVKHDDALQEQISKKVIRMINQYKHDKNASTAEKWDKIKKATKKVIQNYGYEYCNWRKASIKLLGRKRNRILRGKPSPSIRQILIDPIDIQMAKLQKELSEIEGLKAGIRWREKGEKDAGFLKRIHQQRTSQQYMKSIRKLQNDGTQINLNIEISVETTHTSDPNEMREIVRQYYQHLYTLDQVGDDGIDKYLETIHFEKKAASRENDMIMAPITIEEILQQVKRSPKQSSPGEDGLGYQYLQL